MRWLCLFLLPMWGIFSASKAEYGNCKNPDRKLRVVETVIHVHGRPSTVYELLDHDGSRVIRRKEGNCFNLVVENTTSVPTAIHWHGLILPVKEDGVAYVTQPPIPPGASYPYDFMVVQSGSYWAHAHFGLEEQKLMATPLILEPKQPDPYREIILFLEDFSFKTPKEIWQNLRKEFVIANKKKGWTPSFQMPKKAHAPQDLNDVAYDAYLANRRTFDNPEVFRVNAGEKIRLRMINGSAASGFHIELGALEGSIIAVDGSDVIPIPIREFSLATAQRCDVLITIPTEGSIFPIEAQGQGTKMLAGIVLAKENAIIPKMNEEAKASIGGISNRLEEKLRAKVPLEKRKVDRTLNVVLEGNMKDYVWAINGHIWPNNKPLFVKEGERVEILFNNQTGMAHPMHLHGHVFQVVEIDGHSFSGAVRDTILVMPGQIVKVIFDANNPGTWALHCHILYHSWGGMFTVVQYEKAPYPPFTKKEIVDYSRRYGGH